MARTTKASAANSKGAKGDAARSKTRTTAPRARRLTLKRVLLALALLLVVFSATVAIYLASLTGGRFDHDITLLIPEDVGLVIEARHLSGRAASTSGRSRSAGAANAIAELTRFYDALKAQPAYEAFRSSRSFAQMVGHDDRGRARDPAEMIQATLDRYNDVAVPVGDSIYGSLDASEDFLSQEVVIAMRAGDRVIEPDYGPDGPPSDAVAFDPLDPYALHKAEVLLMARVSGRIKAYLSLTWVAEMAGLNEGPNGEKFSKTRGGYYEFALAAGAELMGSGSIYVGLVGDVVMVSTHEDLLADAFALRNSRSGEGSLYASASYRAAVDLARADQQPGAVEAAAHRVYLNAEAVRDFYPLDDLFYQSDDAADPISQASSSATNELRGALIAPEGIHAVYGIVAPILDPTEGPTLQVDLYPLYDPARTPASLLAQLDEVGTPSLTPGLFVDPMFGMLATRIDLIQFTRRMARYQGAEDLVDILEPLAESGWVENKLGVLLAAQDAENVMVGETPSGSMPHVTLVFELSADGRGVEPGRIANLTIARLLARSDADEDADQRYQPFDINGNYLLYFFRPRYEGGPIDITNNKLSATVRGAMPVGPGFDPAAAVVGNRFIFSTDYAGLRRAIEAYSEGRGRLAGDAGDAMVAANAYLPDPATAPGLVRVLIDVSAYNERQSADAQLAAAARTQFPDGVPPSLQTDWVREAQARYGTDTGPQNDAYYEQRHQAYLRNQAAMRAQWITGQRDSRLSRALIRWVAIQLTPLVNTATANDPTAMRGAHLRLAISLGGPTTR